MPNELDARSVAAQRKAYATAAQIDCERRALSAAPAERGVEEPDEVAAFIAAVKLLEDSGWNVIYPGAAPPPPAGMVLMPREPTEAMIAATIASTYRLPPADPMRAAEHVSEVYRALLAAAPGQPAQGDGT